MRVKGYKNFFSKYWHYPAMLLMTMLSMGMATDESIIIRSMSCLDVCFAVYCITKLKRKINILAIFLVTFIHESFIYPLYGVEILMYSFGSLIYAKIIRSNVIRHYKIFGEEYSVSYIALMAFYITVRVLFVNKESVILGCSILSSYVFYGIFDRLHSIFSRKRKKFSAQYGVLLSK